MSNKVNSFSEQKNIEDLIKNKNLLIFDEETWIDKHLWKIAEVTYSYEKIDGYIINTTLFEKAGGLDINLYKKYQKEDRIKLLLKSKEKLINILESKLNQIDQALSIVKSGVIESKTEENIVSIFINSLEEKKNLINYCLKGLIFELEKAGVKSGLTDQQKSSIEEEIKIYDNTLFGGEIKKNSEEVALSYDYIIEKYNSNKKELSNDEQKRFENYLSKIIPYLPEGHKYKENKKPNAIIGDFLNTKLPRSDYILGFNILVESLEKLGHVIETDSSVKSISDGPRGVQFPSTKKFDFMNILRFFKLGNHEIETHIITDYNSRQLLGNLRGSKSTEKDEGLAMFMEQIFIYGNELYTLDKDGDLIIDKSKIRINSYFTKTLMGEILDNHQLLDFLELSEKIDPDVIGAKDRFDRLKRNNQSLVQHKDTTYTRGLFKVIDEINKHIKSKGKEGIAAEDLFLGKISFEETYKLKEVKEEKIKSGEKIETITPLFISDAVYFVVNERLNGNKKNINSECFYKYLRKKYPLFNITKKQVENISNKTKENVSGIVNIMLKNIGRNQIENIKITNKKKSTKKSLIKLIDFQYKKPINRVQNRLAQDRKNAN